MVRVLINAPNIAKFMTFFFLPLNITNKNIDKNIFKTILSLEKDCLSPGHAFIRLLDTQTEFKLFLLKKPNSFQ